MATIIERLAQSHALSDVTDPVEWQRNLRGDRVLPDRDDNAVSAVSYVEVLGYHKLSSTERALFEAFFAAATLLPLSQPVLDQAVKLRQIRKITLGDALVAGTALAHG